MHAQRLNITLPYTLARDFKRAIPAKKRSKFIADAVREKLPKRNLKKELIKSLRANKKYYEKVAKEIQEDFKYADAEIWERLP
ncbi:hypothetical protein HYU92_06250 [Candidatus Curtissbacteria bacterium]|nr:hypothetical protein [Candidatus Curtissbacteria bacterium]